jgi:hypothetical protein
MDGQAKLELDRPRSIPEQLVAALALYRRVPVLFLVLAAIIVVPYELIVLAITHKGPFAQGQLGFINSELLFGIDSVLISPLVSALHAHAVREVADGGRPRLLPTVRRSLPTLFTVAIAAGVSSVAITLGAFVVVPGLILWAMWAVAAQTAALEGGSWIDALRRSQSLTRDHRWHALRSGSRRGADRGGPLVPALACLSPLVDDRAVVRRRHRPASPHAVLRGLGRSPPLLRPDRPQPRAGGSAGAGLRRAAFIRPTRHRRSADPGLLHRPGPAAWLVRRPIPPPPDAVLGGRP